MGLLHLGLLAAPAFAHGGGGSDASNYRSVVDVVATAESAADPSEREAVDLDGVTWSVLASDALLQVHNTTDSELIVLGDDGEPYLRVGPDGVFENRNSPTTYRNFDKLGLTPIPEHAAPDAEPDWVKVSDQPVHAWADRRIQWTAPTLPAQVKVDATQPVKVNDWVVPFEISGQDLAVTGRLTWEPPPPWWPWLVGGIVIAALPVLLAYRLSELAERRRFALRAAGAVFAVVIVINIVHGVDDLIAVPATVGQNVTAGAQTFLPLLLAGWATWKALKAQRGAAQVLLLGAFALVIPLGLTHTAVLLSSQVVSTLPEGFTRLAVASQFAVLGPTAVAILASGELRPEQTEPAADAGPAAARGVG